MGKSSKKRSENLSTAIEEIYRLTKVKAREQHLYIESIVFGNARLSLGIIEEGPLLELVRIPSHYLIAHCISTFMLIFMTCIAVLDPNFGLFAPIAFTTITIAITYGTTYWVNDQAKKSNPLLSFDRIKQQLAIPTKNIVIDQSEIGCIIALSGNRKNAHKPESSNSKLKLIYQNNGKTHSLPLAKNSRSHLPEFDVEIMPLAKTLNVPYLHVDKSFRTNKWEVTRIA